MAAAWTTTRSSTHDPPFPPPQVSLPWYHITPARTFLAAASLKMLTLSLPNCLFPVTLAVAGGHLVPLGLAQTLAALVGGAALAYLARSLDEVGFMGTKWAWPKLVVGCVAAIVLAARLLPRGNTVAPILRVRAADAAVAARAAAPERPTGGPPRLRTSAEAEAEATALLRGAPAPKRGRAPVPVRR